ncbi:MAG: hypothetical protein HFI33_14190 [Lachnospiraceae bacterium]|nr:hypothetical protein [Lachnospiraceae bacterium]
MSMNLKISNHSPLELPPGCQGVMESQARELFRQEDREEPGKPSPHDTFQNRPIPEIPLPGKASVVTPMAEEFPQKKHSDPPKA